MPQITSNSSLNPNANVNGINWVPGLEGAKGWKMYPNTMDVLMDNVNEGIFYIKTTDNVGMVSALRAFSYKEIPITDVPDPNKPASIPQNVITRDDLDAFKAEILEVIKSSTVNKKQHYNNGGNHNERT